MKVSGSLSVETCSPVSCSTSTSGGVWNVYSIVVSHSSESIKHISILLPLIKSSSGSLSEVTNIGMPNESSPHGCSSGSILHRHLLFSITGCWNLFTNWESELLKKTCCRMPLNASKLSPYSLSLNDPAWKVWARAFLRESTLALGSLLDNESSTINSSCSTLAAAPWGERALLRAEESFIDEFRVFSWLPLRW